MLRLGSYGIPTRYDAVTCSGIVSFGIAAFRRPFFGRGLDDDASRANDRGADFLDFAPQNFIFLALQRVASTSCGGSVARSAASSCVSPAHVLRAASRASCAARISATQPLEFFEIASLGGAGRFGLQHAVPDQVLFPFDRGFQNLFAVRDHGRRGFEGDLVGLMLKPQGRKLPFKTLDRGGSRRKRLALPRHTCLKRRPQRPAAWRRALAPPRNWPPGR